MIKMSHTQFARTDWVKNNVNPEFSQAIELDYCFEEVQRLRYVVISMVPSSLVPRLLPCGLGTRLDDIKLNGQHSVCYSTPTVAIIIKHLHLALFHTTVGNMQECLAKITPCVANSSCSRRSLHCAIYSMKPCKEKCQRVL